ncbi:MAG: DNA repair protein RecO [Mariprofundaceae bacterium]
MAEIRDRALLLRRIPYGETSLVIHLLTAEHGRIALMARGARRPKSPFRATLEPLYQLSMAWRPGRTGMGTLVDAERHAGSLLDEEKMLSGLELLAVASGLFREGDMQGFAEVLGAFHMLAERPEDSGLCAAIWHLLQQSGWVGELNHCWQCGSEVGETDSMGWENAQLVCQSCASGVSISAGLRKSIVGHMQQANVLPTRADIPVWRSMIRDVLHSHGIKYPAAMERS